MRVFVEVLLVIAMLLPLTAAHGSDGKAMKVVVRSVEFRGNETFGGLALRGVIANRERTLSERLAFWAKTGYEFDELEVRRDAIRIQRYYHRRGFPNATVVAHVRDGNQDWQKRIRFVISEGDPVLVEVVDLVWTDSLAAADIQNQRAFRRALNRAPLRVGRRMEPILLADTEGLFTSTLQNLGHAFAAVRAKSDSTRLVITLDPGPVTYLDSIRVEGNVSVTPDLVRRESGLATGDRFYQRAIGRAQQEIYSHHLFRFVTVSVPEQPRDTTVNLVIRVRERPLRSIKTTVGLGNEELLRGNASWTHRNPFGNAHSLTVSARASFIEQRVNVDYLFPYIFNTRSSFLIAPFAQRLDEPGFTLVRLGATNNFLYRYSQNLVGSVAYEITRNEEFLKTTTRILRDSTQFYDQSALQLSGYYQESPAERSQGWSIRPFFEHSGVLGLGTINYQRASVDVRRYFNLSQSSQLAVRVETGALFASELDRIPANVRYYAGGTNNVRGYDRWQLGPKRANADGLVPDGGRGMLIFNTEWRQDISGLLNGFGVNVFFDGGQVWRLLSEYGVSDLNYATGAGVRYSSPLGPVRVDVGYKLNPSRTDLDTATFGRWGIHFSIGQAF